MESRQVAGQIAAIAALLNVTVRVTDGTGWVIRDREIIIGTGGYLQAGLDGEALNAAIMLDMWADVGLTVRSAARARFKQALVHDRPDLQPLISTIDRIQASAELVTAFPGFRAGLAASVAHRFSGDLSEAPEPAQFLAHTLLTAAAPDASIHVSRRVQDLLVPDTVVRVAMTPADPPDAKHTFMRLLASLMPAYDALQQTASPGLATSGADADPPEETDAFGSGSASHDAQPDDEAQNGDASGSATEDERERPGDAPERAEGADLFEAKQAGDVTAMLETPLATLSPTELAGVLGDDHPTAQTAQAQDTPLPGDRVRAETTEHLRLARYLERYRLLEPHVQALRDVWDDLLSERTTVSHRMGRTPVSDGETLMRSALPSAIAQVRAGAPRPKAYVARTRHVRTREEFGNTDVVVLIDRSGSMRSASQHAADAALILTEALAAVTRDVEREERRLGLDLELELRTALIVFDTEPVVVKPLSRAVDDTSRARLVAESLVTGGGTHDAAALEEAARQLGLVGAHHRQRSGIPRRRVLIMVSDGGSQEPDLADSILQYLEERGVTVYGISVGSEALRERYGSRARRVDDPRDIVRVMRELISATAHPTGRSEHAAI